ncbi:hypothetical protein ABH09_04775 [Treponema sp. OMZ 803]|uniref:hypothetical protein n=1 Tax=Treponema sp. OMZ 803 TaxID=120682 RepID=UPI0020A4FA98|nr:hypothetical protein [Treponema sp. OMZ 803]UTC53965.1 hypothetical protein ABH09_04775 [Treponema sp. OMZ 803]
MFFFFTLLVMVVLSRFTKTPRSILIRLAVFIIVWGNFTGLCFMNKYSIEEKCKTVSELNDKDRKQIAEDIIKHNKIVNLSFLGLAKVDTNKYPNLFPDTEITSSEAECKVLGKERRSILPYFFALSCVLSLILFGGIIMEGEPL